MADPRDLWIENMRAELQQIRERVRDLKRTLLAKDTAARRAIMLAGEEEPEIWMRDHQRYFDREGLSISMGEWCLLFENREYHVVEQTYLCDDPPIFVSTVWLGLDHGFGGERKIFETLEFPAQKRMIRYATEEEARAGHEELTARFIRAFRARPELLKKFARRAWAEQDAFRLRMLERMDDLVGQLGQKAK